MNEILFAALRVGPLEFQAVDPSWFWLSAWAVLIAVGFGVLIWTYAGIVRRSRQLWAWGLMLLRGVGLLALLLALAKPVWTSQTVTVEAGRVAVVLDNSLSMSLPTGDGTPRYDVARAAVDRLQKNLSGAGPRVVVEVFDIAGKPLPSVPDKPTATQTLLRDALRGPEGQQGRRPPLAIVLISDGVDSSGATLAKADDFAGSTVPVYTLGFPALTDTDSQDLSVKSAQPPKKTIMIHDEVRVGVTVAKASNPATTAKVRIRRGTEDLVEQEVTLGEGPQEQLVDLTFKPKQVGTFIFTASIDSGKIDRTPDNNAANFPLTVTDERIRVLYVEGFLRPELKFLKRRLEDDTGVALETDIRQLSPERVKGQLPADALTPEKLKNVDVMILGDLPGSYLSPVQVDAVVKWLDDKNKGLLLLSGYESYGPAGLRTTALRDVLPTEFIEAGPSQSEDEFIMEPTPGARGGEVFSITRDPVKDAAEWAKAPKLRGCSLVKPDPKAAAVVLATNPKTQVDGKPAIVAAWQPYGGGKTMVLTAETWPWARTPVLLGGTDTLHSKFWGQTIRWLANRPPEADRPPLTVRYNQPNGSGVNQSVKFTIDRYSADGKLKETDARIKVTPPRGDAIALPIKKESLADDTFAAELFPSVDGRFEYESELVTKEGTVVANQKGEFYVQGENLELKIPEARPMELEKLSGKEQYRDATRADEVATMLQALPKAERRTVNVRRWDLWNSWTLFAVFVLAVSGEWLIRRRNHLV